MPRRPSWLEVNCNDNIDEDGDTLIDCLDDECDGIDNCEFSSELSCDDEIDNDGDGLLDCLDDDCAASVDCLTE